MFLASHIGWWMLRAWSSIQSVFLRDLLASGKSAATLRSYAVDLLRWWRFLDAVDVAWDRASRAEARDFSCWIQLTVKQWLQTTRPRAARWSSRTLGAPNPVTGKPAAGRRLCAVHGGA